MQFIEHIKEKLSLRKPRKKAKQLGKKLLVIGDPSNGGFNYLFGTVYGCGDICIDLVGCKGCHNSMKGDALEILRKLPDNSYVIYESCVLEAVNYDVTPLIKEIKRVSGGNYFNVRVGPSTMYFYYFPSLWTGEGSNIKYIKQY